MPHASRRTGHALDVGAGQALGLLAGRQKGKARVSAQHSRSGVVRPEEAALGRASDIDVPQEHASVDAHRDELLVIRAELHRADGARVANALADHLGGLEVPHAHLS